MSDVLIEARWEGGQRFEAVGKAGVPVLVDGEGEAGPTPVETLLIALAACMAADVVDILTKMRVGLEALSVRAEGDRRPEPPRRYTAVRLVYRVEGVAETEREKLERALSLSREKYCSVLHTLRSDLDLTTRIDVG